MLVDLVIKALLIIATSLGSAHNSDAVVTEPTVYENDRVVTFELPSFENLIEKKKENEDLWVIDLPEVEIVATYTGKNRFEATLIEGEMVPMIQLDEVVITAPRKM
ncbi:MAG: hypothetical protein HKN39_02770 [Flavobacteriales bacterium]|nr:hypothetical protein [Flavobacteriales bacterium]